MCSLCFLENIMYWNAGPIPQNMLYFALPGKWERGRQYQNLLITISSNFLVVEKKYVLNQSTKRFSGSVLYKKW